MPEVTPEPLPEMSPEVIPPEVAMPEVIPPEEATPEVITPEEVVRLAADGTYGELSYSVNEDSTVTITDCDTAAVNVTVPDTIDGMAVVGIGEWAFYACTGLESVSIPEGVTSIGDYTFYNCTSLKSVSLPASLTEVGSWAFYGCESMERVYISDLTEYLTIEFVDDNSYPTYYGADIYVNNEPLTELVIPEGIAEIPPYVFNGCTSLKSVVLPEGVTSIGDRAFFDCTGLESVSIPEGVTSIGERVFYNCTSLKSVSLPDSLEIIGDSVFCRCESMERVYISDLTEYLAIEFVDDKSYPTYYGADIYVNNEPLTELVIPEGIAEIPPYVFNGCTSLKSVTFPEGVTKIGDFSFGLCSGLERISLPESLECIGASSFYRCLAIEGVYITDLKEFLTIEFVFPDSNPMYYADELYLNNELLTNLVIPDGITEIPTYAFMHCSSLKSVTIPEGVTSIGAWAFGYCISLRDINIPQSVTSIGIHSMSGCNNLRKVYYPGTEDQWNNIDIGHSNEFLINAVGLGRYKLEILNTRTENNILTVTVCVTNNTGKNALTTLVAPAYGSGGELLGIATAEKVLVAGDNAVELYLDCSTFGEDFTFGVFMWDSLSGMRSLCPSI